MNNVKIIGAGRERRELSFEGKVWKSVLRDFKLKIAKVTDLKKNFVLNSPYALNLIDFWVSEDLISS